MIVNLISRSVSARLSSASKLEGSEIPIGPGCSCRVNSNRNSSVFVSRFHRLNITCLIRTAKLPVKATHIGSCLGFFESTVQRTHKKGIRSQNFSGPTEADERVSTPVEAAQSPRVSGGKEGGGDLTLPSLPGLFQGGPRCPKVP